MFQCFCHLLCLFRLLLLIILVAIYISLYININYFIRYKLIKKINITNDKFSVKITTIDAHFLQCIPSSYNCKHFLNRYETMFARCVHKKTNSGKLPDSFYIKFTSYYNYYNIIIKNIINYYYIIINYFIKIV